VKWHAPHPADARRPLCGTVGEDGAPTQRVAKTLTVTCARCKKALAKLENEQRQREAYAPMPMEPWQAGLM
jgi:hypothetical protein